MLVTVRTVSGAVVVILNAEPLLFVLTTMTETKSVAVVAMALVDIAVVAALLTPTLLTGSTALMVAVTGDPVLNPNVLGYTITTALPLIVPVRVYVETMGTGCGDSVTVTTTVVAPLLRLLPRFSALLIAC